METKRSTPSSSARRALLILTLGLLVGSLPLTANAKVAVKAKVKVGPVTVRLDSGGRSCRQCGHSRVVTIRDSRTRVVRNSCRPVVTKRSGRRCGNEIWIPGHYKVKRHFKAKRHGRVKQYNRRVWIPGHWERVHVIR